MEEWRIVWRQGVLNSIAPGLRRQVLEQLRYDLENRPELFCYKQTVVHSDSDPRCVIQCCPAAHLARLAIPAATTEQVQSWFASVVASANKRLNDTNGFGGFSHWWDYAYSEEHVRAQLIAEIDRNLAGDTEYHTKAGIKQTVFI
jgi:hypothetical protein